NRKRRARRDLLNGRAAGGAEVFLNRRGAEGAEAFGWGSRGRAQPNDGRRLRRIATHPPLPNGVARRKSSLYAKLIFTRTPLHRAQHRARVGSRARSRADITFASASCGSNRQGAESS